MPSRKSFRGILLIVLLGVMASCIIHGNGSASFTLVNNSSYELIELNLSPVDSWSWGRNLLGRYPLLPGESITIDFIDCDTYDIRVVDDTYDECILYDVTLCFSDDVWVIRDSLLNSCGF